MRLGLCGLLIRLARALLIVVSVVIVFFAISARSQDSSTGAVRGFVSDASGGRLGRCSVRLANNATGIVRSAFSSNDGSFAFELLPPGEYSLRTDFPGMSPGLIPSLRVEVGGSLQLDLRLQIAGTNETVNVSDSPTMVETKTSEVASVIEERAISDLPLNGRRFSDLALLTPGVTQDPRGLTSATNGDLAFGGIRGYQSSFLVDGADNNNSFFGQARGRYRAPYQFSNEVVQEFRVSSNSYGAELGRAGGAVINVVTKSGTNHMHGSAFYYLRDSLFNAQHAFADVKPSDRQHQFGFTVGGPIRRNRAFFYGGFDQHIFRVPTLVRFGDGRAAVVPQPGNYPIVPPDYEASDQATVFAAASQLSNLGGDFRSSLLGNAGFFKVDLNLSSRNFLNLRVNTSRYYGSNDVFFDPASPVTNFSISDNGEEDVTTESGTASLTTAISSHTTSHLRLQFSRDLQSSIANSDAVRTKIYGVIDAFGRSSILPRSTREHKFHAAETIGVEHGRHSVKFGGDFLLTTIYNYFPSLSGGEYIFDDIRVNPFTFQPNVFGTKLTPLRAYAHNVPRYYLQNFGSYASHPDTNEYSSYVQDTVRVTDHLALNLGARYDLQTFTTKGLVSNPLWPDSGKVPMNPANVGPRVGFASAGSERPLVIRGGYGWFYTRIPQIYTSSIATDNGISSVHLFLDNKNFFDHLAFPSYPNPLVNCPTSLTFCAPPTGVSGNLTSDISAFAPNFQTPKIQQASLSIEREVADRFAVGVSYLYVHGQDLIRARDINLPMPQIVRYPVFDESGDTFLGTYYDIPTFSTWQFSQSLTCPFPPCINPLQRPVSALGAINEFESAASSIYNGLTVSVRRRMTEGMYFRVSYTWAHSIDDGQDSLVVGRPSTVQNTFSPNAERGSSVTDQRQRLAISWVVEPRIFHRDHAFLASLFNDWKFSGVETMGSGRPWDARIVGDPNQDGNSSNDRLPGFGRNSFVGPDYATTDMRIGRDLHLGDRLKLTALVESFNLLNRTNGRVDITDDGFRNSAGQFVQFDKRVAVNHFPAYYRVPANFKRTTNAYAPRQMQFSLRLAF